MLVFDAIIIYTDRHFGLLVDNHTNKIPIFDNGLSLQ